MKRASTQCNMISPHTVIWDLWLTFKGDNALLRQSSGICSLLQGGCSLPSRGAVLCCATCSIERLALLAGWDHELTSQLSLPLSEEVNKGQGINGARIAMDRGEEGSWGGMGSPMVGGNIIVQWQHSQHHLSSWGDCRSRGWEFNISFLTYPHSEQMIEACGLGIRHRKGEKAPSAGSLQPLVLLHIDRGYGYSLQTFGCPTA